MAIDFSRTNKVMIIEKLNSSIEKDLDIKDFKHGEVEQAKKYILDCANDFNNIMTMEDLEDTIRVDENGVYLKGGLCANLDTNEIINIWSVFYDKNLSDLYGFASYEDREKNGDLFLIKISLSTLGKLINDIKETSKKSCESYKFEDNTSINYIAIENLEDETDAYFFQDEEADNLRKEYENSCVYGLVTLEEYIRNSHVSW